MEQKTPIMELPNKFVFIFTQSACVYFHSVKLLLPFGADRKLITAGERSLGGRRELHNLVQIETSAPGEFSEWRGVGEAPSRSLCNSPCHEHADIMNAADEFDPP
jgi:hypothetical protein